MKTKATQLIIKCVVIFTALLISCDPFQEDLIPREKQVIVNPSATDYYILPGTSTIIDLKTIVSSTFTNVTIKVTENPTRGELTSLGEFLLMYKPVLTFTEGNDQFKVSFTRDGKLLKTETLTVHMTQNTTEFPCALYAVEDIAYTKPDSAISIKFLANDRICGIDVQNIQTSIVTEPQHGQALIKGDSIIYIPEAEFEGSDEMVYRISAVNNLRTSSGDSLLVSYGLIKAHVMDAPCPFFILDSYVLDLTDSVDDLINTGECNGGYDITVWGVSQPCDNYSFSFSHITQTYNSGGFCLGLDGRIAYYPDNNKSPKNDTAQFRVCVNTQCKDVTIYVIREHSEAGEWTELISVGVPLRSVFFIDPQVGYVGGDSGTIFKTMDGGTSWNRLERPFLTEFSPGAQFGTITGICFTNSTGFVTGTWLSPYGPHLEGLLRTGFDKGNIHDLIFYLNTVPVDILFTNEATGFMIFHMPDHSGGGETIFQKTVDGGKSWGWGSGQGGFVGELYEDLHFDDGSTVYARSSNAIMKTSDAANWSVLATFDWISALTVNDGQFYAIINSNADKFIKTKIWTSTDGAGWTLVYEDPAMEPYPEIRSLEFSPTNKLGFAYGSKLVYSSSDKGKTWYKESIPHLQGSSTIEKIVWVSDSVAYAICSSNDGLVLKYTRK